MTGFSFMVNSLMLWLLCLTATSISADGYVVGEVDGRGGFFGRVWGCSVGEADGRGGFFGRVWGCSVGEVDGRGGFFGRVWGCSVGEADGRGGFFGRAVGFSDISVVGSSVATTARVGV